MNRRKRYLAGSLIALATLAVGTTALWFSRLQADPGMPPAYRAYWSWVGAIRQDPASAVAQGQTLLAEYPNLPWLYLRLADVCRAQTAASACRPALEAALPPDAHTRLYRQVSLLILDGEDSREPWQKLAADPALDPKLARLLVDRAWPEAVAPLEGQWQQRLAADTAALGALFGLGYIAALRSQWDEAEVLLRRAVAQAPEDPEAYRELGRVYFFTGQPEHFERALKAGIEAAEARHDLEQELILRGNLGWELYNREGDLAEAEHLVASALEQARLLSDEATEGFNLYRLAHIYARQHRYDEVFPLLDQAEGRYAEYAPHQYPYVLLVRGTTLASLFRFTEAEQIFQRAIEEAEQRQNTNAHIEALVWLANLRYRMGRYQQARQVGREALDLATRYQFREREIVAQFVLGDIEHRWGNYEVAASHYEQALEVAEEIENHVLMREGLSRLGRLALLLQDANSAQRHFETVLESLQQEGNTIETADALIGMGRTLEQFRNTTEALRYYDEALAHLDDTAESHRRPSVLFAKAWALFSIGAFEEAAGLFREAQRLQPDVPLVAYRAALGLGEVALSQEDYQQALDHFRQATAIERRLPHPSAHWYVLFGQALAHWRLGNEEAAEAAFEEAIEMIEALRENLAFSTNRASFVGNKVRVYEHFSVFLEAQGRRAEALHYIERARSRGLVDLLFTTQQSHETTLARPADQMLELDRRVRALAQELEPALPDVSDEPDAYRAVRAEQLRREYARAEARYQSVRSDVSQQQPMFTFQPLDAETMQRTLHDGEAMLLYDLRQIGMRQQEEDRSVVYLVLPDTLIVRPLPLGAAALEQTIRFFREQIADPSSGDAWKPAARRLHRALIAPLLDALPPETRHLHLVPEGFLHYLPFAALLDEDSERFLAERFTLSVAPSASILKLAREQNPRRWRSMLLVADPEGRLPGARAEALSLQSESPGRRLALVGDQATQATVEELADSYDILHFATHGRFVPQAPLQSHLELYEDGLSVEEIGRLRLDAYLVTLSACETALSGGLVSDVPVGDEWVGLNQAFLAAGTPTVMASLWPIDDRVSSRFMVEFYGGLGAGGKAVALARVQRRFIAGAEEMRHPFYWTPFIVVGDPL